jgi:hypothetical protein
MKIIMMVLLKQAHNDNTCILLHASKEPEINHFSPRCTFDFSFSSILSCVVVRFVSILLHVEHI